MMLIVWSANKTSDAKNLAKSLIMSVQFHETVRNALKSIIVLNTVDYSNLSNLPKIVVIEGYWKIKKSSYQKL